MKQMEVEIRTELKDPEAAVSKNEFTYQGNIEITFSITEPGDYLNVSLELLDAFQAGYKKKTILSNHPVLLLGEIKLFPVKVLYHRMQVQYVPLNWRGALTFIRIHVGDFVKYAVYWRLMHWLHRRGIADVPEGAEPRLKDIKLFQRI